MLHFIYLVGQFWRFPWQRCGIRKYIVYGQSGGFVSEAVTVESCKKACSSIMTNWLFPPTLLHKNTWNQDYVICIAEIAIVCCILHALYIQPLKFIKVWQITWKYSHLHISVFWLFCLPQIRCTEPDDRVIRNVCVLLDDDSHSSHFLCPVIDRRVGPKVLVVVVRDGVGRDFMTTAMEFLQQKRNGNANMNQSLKWHLLCILHSRVASHMEMWIASESDYQSTSKALFNFVQCSSIARDVHLLPIV